MILKLKNILPNPYRDLVLNPLIEEKITELVTSIGQTGFWENVVVRKNKDGKYELAYGHHRLAAAIRAGLTEADFIVKPFTDAQMIQVMDSENRETYGSTPKSIIESVKAVVLSLAAGTIPPFEISKDTKKAFIRYAPSFAPGVDVINPVDHVRYTAMHIAQFLGRTQAQPNRDAERADPGVMAALDALFLKEKGRFSDSMLKKKDDTGAVVPITMRELRQRTSAIKQDYARIEKTQKKTAEEIAQINAASRKAQEDFQAEQKRIKEEREALVKKQAEAKAEEDRKRVKAISEKLDAKEAEEEKNKVEFKIRQEAFNAQVEAAKEKAAAAKAEDAYLPVRREVDRIVHILERREEEEAVKALARRDIRPPERERLRQAAISKGNWYLDWVAQQFIPPLSAKKKNEEYRLREQAKRRAEEEKKRKAEEKKSKEKK